MRDAFLKQLEELHKMLAEMGLLSISLSFKSTFASSCRIFAACSRSMCISAS